MARKTAQRVAVTTGKLSDDAIAKIGVSLRVAFPLASAALQGLQVCNNYLSRLVPSELLSGNSNAVTQNRGQQCLVLFLISLSAVFPSASRSEVNDSEALREGAKLCMGPLPGYERQYGIPKYLLAAIGSVESGRYDEQAGLSLPWPWTLNVRDKSYFYGTKAEAVAATQEFQRNGFQSVSVGCMQVNLEKHPTAFANLDQAFEPAYNIAFASRLLKHNFDTEGSWQKAVAVYRSLDPAIGAIYARQVSARWSEILSKSGANPHAFVGKQTDNHPSKAGPQQSDGQLSLLIILLLIFFSLRHSMPFLNRQKKDKSMGTMFWPLFYDMFGLNKSSGKGNSGKYQSGKRTSSQNSGESRKGGQKTRYNSGPETSSPPGDNKTMTREEAEAILGLSPLATKQEIKEAHSRLIKKLHPDVGGNDYLASKINQARDVLMGMAR